MTTVKQYDAVTGHTQTLHEDPTDEGAASYLAAILAQDHSDEHVIYLSKESS